MTLAETFAEEFSAVPPLPLQRRDIKKLAVFRALQLGDMLCAVPALRTLRGALPGAHITLVGLPWAEQFARRFHAYIDDFVAFPGHPALPEQEVQQDRVADFYRSMCSCDFDLALQLHGSGKISNGIVAAFGARTIAGYAKDKDGGSEGFLVDYPDNGPEPLRLLNLVSALGAAPAETHLEFPINEEDERELRDSGIGADLDAGSYICIHPGARMRSKCWAPQRFAEVADRIADESGLRIVLTGSGKEIDLTSAVAAHMHHAAVNAVAPISIGAMAALMRDARLLISNDTGVSHIAAGLRLPSVVIFTIADMQRWAPLDQALHRCLRDQDGAQVNAVLAHARSLLEEHAGGTPCGRRCQS